MESNGSSGRLVSRPNNVQKVRDMTKRLVKKQGIANDEYKESLRGIDHKTIRMALFSTWAPFYDAYWEVTGHAHAAREVLKQLSVVGEKREEKIFKGKGLDLACGTGLIEVELGRIAERKTLERMRARFKYPNGGEHFRSKSPIPEDIMDPKYTNTVPDIKTMEMIAGLVDTCMDLQYAVEALLADPDSDISNPVSEHLRKVMKLILIKDIGNEYVAELKEYQLLKKMINMAPWDELINNPKIALLTRVYLRNAVFVRNVLHDNTFYPNTGEALAAKKEFTRFFNIAFREVWSIVGVDMSPEMLEIAKRKCRHMYGGMVYKEGENGIFVEADITSLPKYIATQKFDFVVLSQIIHLLRDEERTELLREVASVLEPGSRLVLLDEYHPLFSGSKLADTGEKVMEIMGSIQELFKQSLDAIPEKGELRKLVESAGFAYTGIRASHPIDSDHKMLGHVYKRVIPSGDTGPILVQEG